MQLKLKETPKLEFGKLYKFKGSEFEFVLLFPEAIGAINHYKSRFVKQPHPGLLDTKFWSIRNPPSFVASELAKHWTLKEHRQIQVIPSNSCVLALNKEILRGVHLQKVLGPESAGWILAGEWVTTSFELLSSLLKENNVTL